MTSVSMEPVRKERESAVKAQEKASFCSHRRKSCNWNPINSPHLLPRIKKKKKAAQHRRLKHMAGSGRKQGRDFFSKAPHPPTAPPCDVITFHGQHMENETNVAQPGRAEQAG